MDGNGRLSRFLFHHALCQSGRLDQGLLLSVSIAMKREEAFYLAALETFSKPARTLWDVRWIDEDQFDFAFRGPETEHLARIDRIREAVNAEYDVRDNDLNVLIISALQAGGVVSKNRRKQHALSVQPEVFDFIEALAKRELLDAEDGPQS